MVGWHHRLDGHEFEYTPGDSEGQGSLACCSPWGRRESDTTEQLSSNRELDSVSPHRAVLMAGRDSVSAQDAAPDGEGAGTPPILAPQPHGHLSWGFNPPQLASASFEGPVWGHLGGGGIAPPGEVCTLPCCPPVGLSILGRVPGCARRPGVAWFRTTKSSFSPA